jgi:hypothetical protein
VFRYQEGPQASRGLEGNLWGIRIGPPNRREEVPPPFYCSSDKKTPITLSINSSLMILVLDVNENKNYENNVNLKKISQTC